MRTDKGLLVGGQACQYFEEEIRNLIDSSFNGVHHWYVTEILLAQFEDYGYGRHVHKLILHICTTCKSTDNPAGAGMPC